LLAWFEPSKFEQASKSTCFLATVLIEAPSVIAPPATPGACIEAAQTSLAFMLGTVAWKDNKENLDHVSSQHIAEAVLKVFGPYATLIVAALAALYGQVCGRV
jgi:hypothetical protein